MTESSSRRRKLELVKDYFYPFSSQMSKTCHLVREKEGEGKKEIVDLITIYSKVSETIRY